MPDTPATPVTLLQRLCAPGTQAPSEVRQDWDAFAKLYAPPILRWVRKNGFAEQDAQDLTADILVKLLRDLPKYRRTDSKFSSWLRVVVRNHCIDILRAKDDGQGRRHLSLSGGMDVAATDRSLSEFEDAEDRQARIARLTDIARRRFGERTWSAFSLFWLDQLPVAAIAARLGTTPNAVHQAVHRVMSFLREFRDLLG